MCNTPMSFRTSLNNHMCLTVFSLNTTRFDFSSFFAFIKPFETFFIGGNFFYHITSLYTSRMSTSLVRWVLPSCKSFLKCKILKRMVCNIFITKLHIHVWHYYSISTFIVFYNILVVLRLIIWTCERYLQGVA